MPTIACPGCGKQYKLPESAAGQVAKCACGKKFKVGFVGAASAAATLAPSQVGGDFVKPAMRRQIYERVEAAALRRPRLPRRRTRGLQRQLPRRSTTTSGTKDSRSQSRGAASAARSEACNLLPTPSSRGTRRRLQMPPQEKEEAKSGGVKWGFDWGKVVGGTVDVPCCWRNHLT